MTYETTKAREPMMRIKSVLRFSLATKPIALTHGVNLSRGYSLIRPALGR